MRSSRKCEDSPDRSVDPHARRLRVIAVGLRLGLSPAALPASAFGVDEPGEYGPGQRRVIGALGNHLAGALVGHHDVVVLEVILAVVGLAIELDFDDMILWRRLELLLCHGSLWAGAAGNAIDIAPSVRLRAFARARTEHARYWIGLVVVGTRLASIAASLALSVGLTAQTPGSAARPTPPQGTGTGVIAGSVFADSGAPIARARVALSSAAFKSILTDERGGFVFASLPPGEYTLSVSRIGYLDVVYGQRQPGSGRSGTPIRLESGQRFDGIALRLPRGAVITGTVLDENGEPAIGVPVRAYRWRNRGGEPTLSASSFDHTDDRGIYRIPFLAPGGYIVAATPRSEIEALPLAGDASQQAASSYAPVFFPGTTQASEASLISVGISEERPNVDIRLQRVTTGRLAGVVLGTGGSPQSGARVTLGASRQWLTSAGTRSARTGANGQFAFSDVPPGSYALIVRTDGATPLWGRAEVVTDGRDTGGVQIALQRGLNVTGTVNFDVASPESGAAGIRLSLADAGPSALEEAMTTTVLRNGMFALRNVPPGRYQLTAASLPAGYSLATAMFGGRDVLDSTLDVSEDLTGVVTISTRSTELTGSLLDDAGRPVSDYTILAFAAEPRFWARRSRRIQTTRPATDGRFVLQGLPAGTYRLAVISDAEPGQETDPEFLQQIAAESDLVSLSEGEHRVHNLTFKSR